MRALVSVMFAEKGGNGQPKNYFTQNNATLTYVITLEPL